MANIIKRNVELDVTGSNSYNGIVGQSLCIVFDAEPTAAQEKVCRDNGWGMQWANGRIYPPPGMENILSTEHGPSFDLLDILVTIIQKIFP